LIKIIIRYKLRYVIFNIGTALTLTLTISDFHTQRERSRENDSNRLAQYFVISLILTNFYLL
jgi:hypothetical protein